MGADDVIPRTETVEDEWLHYRQTVEDQLASCADYLDRLQRSLAGEIAPDRHYFNEKAGHLLSAVRGLVQLGQDVERWAGECREQFDVEGGDGPYTTICTLPAGHPGDHDEPTHTIAERLQDKARGVAERGQQVSDRISWLTIRTDRDAKLGQIAERDDRVSLAEVEGEARGLAADASRLVSGMCVLRRQAGTRNDVHSEVMFERLYQISQRQGPGLSL
jgi:hypothetical protein